MPKGVDLGWMRGEEADLRGFDMDARIYRGAHTESLLPPSRRQLR